MRLITPSRRERKHLERRADRVLSRVQERLRDQGPLDFMPSDFVAIALEPGDVVILERALAQFAFFTHGIVDLLVEIDAARDANPYCLPVAIIIDGWCQAGWIPLLPMVSGGAA